MQASLTSVPRVHEPLEHTPERQMDEPQPGGAIPQESMGLARPALPQTQQAAVEATDQQVYHGGHRALIDGFIAAVIIKYHIVSVTRMDINRFVIVFFFYKFSNLQL